MLTAHKISQTENDLLPRMISNYYESLIIEFTCYLLVTYECASGKFFVCILRTL